MNPLAGWPDEDEENQLLAALCAGGPTAQNALAARYLPLLASFLRAAYPRASDDHIHGAVDSALMSFLVRTASYDPARGSLCTYLRLSARGDLVNALARDGKRRGASLDSVADLIDYRKDTRTHDDPLADPRIATEVAALSAKERAVLELMIEGVRDTAVYAEVLGLLHSSAEVRRTEVKRVKDRLQKRFGRALGDSR